MAGEEISGTDGHAMLPLLLVLSFPTSAAENVPFNPSGMISPFATLWIGALFV